MRAPPRQDCKNNHNQEYELNMFRRHVCACLGNSAQLSERLDSKNDKVKVAVGGPNQNDNNDNRKPKRQKSEVTMEIQSVNLTPKVQIERSKIEPV